MKRRIVSLALAFFFMAALLPAPALAYDTGTAGQANIVSAGGNHTSFVDKDGTLWMWGENHEGQLGNGSWGDDSSVPIKVLDHVTCVSCGGDFTAAIKTDGTLWMWGSNSGGALGNGVRGIGSDEPVKVLDHVTCVSCGGDMNENSGHTAAIRTDGTLWMWGNNDYGQLGNGGEGNVGDNDGFDQTVPVKVLDNVVAVSCGRWHTAAIRTDGSLWMWGRNSAGQLGTGTTDNSSVPVKVLDNVVTVSCGKHTTAAIKTDGTLWIWGGNGYGELGTGTTDNSNVPVRILDSVAVVSCGRDHTAAIRTDGTLWMWGANHYGELGIGTTESYFLAPVRVLNNVAAVSCGYCHTTAIRADGTLWVWGNNDHSQLGKCGEENTDHNGSHLIQTVPIQIAGLTASLDALPFLPLNRVPSYSYPDADTGSDAVQTAAQGAEVAAAYQLADGLYYVLLNQDSGLVGRVVKGVKEQGETVWKVIQSHDEPAAQEELDRLLAQELSTSNLPLDFGRLASLPSVQDVVSYLQDCLDNLNGLTVNDPAKAELATFIESALASLASSSLSSPDNRLTISAKTVSDLAGQAKSAKAKLDEALSGSGIVLNKELDNLLRVLWQDVDSGAPCQVTLDRELANALGQSSLRVLLGDDRHYIQLSPDAVSGLLERYGTVSVQMSQSGETTYAVNFLDDTGEILEQIDFPVTIGLPASGPLNTVMASYAGGSDNWGGQYDESTGSMAFETRYSGQYEVLENDISINDIEALDQETRTAIAFLVSKGYMSAPDGVFQPDIPLSRYDFTQALVGMFFALDRSLTTSFPDVPQDSAYYPYVASAEADDIVEGYDGIFFGEQDITVEQMLAIAARTLRERKGYLPPENADSYLSSLAGADQVAGWARELVAQTVRDGIMDRTDALDPKGGVTRAQAALILYRLFLRLYEVSPVALELPPAVEVPEEPEISEAPAEAEPAEEKSFPAGAVIALVAAGAGAAGAGIYFKKKKSQK